MKEEIKIVLGLQGARDVAFSYCLDTVSDAQVARLSRAELTCELFEKESHPNNFVLVAHSTQPGYGLYVSQSDLDAILYGGE